MQKQENDYLKEYMKKMKEVFDIKGKGQSFKVGDMVLKWDKWREEPSKHGKFDSLWLGPFLMNEEARINSNIFTNL
jgi:hypothetical protein